MEGLPQLIHDQIDSLSDQQIKDEIDAIWTQLIDGYFLSDIENLESIQLQPGKDHGLAAVGQFLSVASMLELLGKILYDDNTRLLYFRYQDLAWEYYFDNYLPASVKKLYLPIQGLVRNGSAHLFLPREVGLSKRLGEDLFFYEGTTTIFNVATFTKLFTDSLPKVKRDLDEKVSLSKRFLKRYQWVRQMNVEEFDKIDKDYSGIIKDYIDNQPKPAGSIPVDVTSIEVTPVSPFVPQTTIPPIPRTTTPVVQPDYGISTKPAHPVPNQGSNLSDESS
jgi:hypothetical protein